MKPTVLKRYGYAWVTLVLFAASLIGHWTFAWFAFVNEQENHNQPVAATEYFIEVSRDTLENWQSEFLQLLWQVAGLAFLWYLGSPQSKEGDDRQEEKIDYLIRGVYGRDAEKIFEALENKYPKA